MKLSALLIIVALIAVFAVVTTLQQCTIDNLRNNYSNDTTIVEKLSVVFVPAEPDTVFYPVPTLVDSKPLDIPDSLLIDTSCDKVKMRYENVLTQLYTQNIYSDTVWYDSLYVIPKLYVSKNILDSSMYIWGGKIKQIHTERTVTYPLNRRKVYIGGNVGADLNFNTYKLGVGFMYKGRNDNITGFEYSVNTLQQQTISIHRYWLLSLKKR